jgi:hypothetical protein
LSKSIPIRLWAAEKPPAFVHVETKLNQMAESTENKFSRELAGHAVGTNIKKQRKKKFYVSNVGLYQSGLAN